MLVDEIIDLLSGSHGSLNEALLKTKILLHRLGRKDLIGWVNAELNGYEPNESVPPYRVVSGRVLAELVSMTFTASAHPVPTRHLNDEERASLETHQILQPIGVLEARDRTEKLIVPIPMESNFRLGGSLSKGVRINNAWIELNGQQIAGISINVRSRLLDFVLELREALGQDIKEADVSSLSEKIDTSALFRSAIFGPHATIIYGNGSAQINVNVQFGNVTSLESALKEAGLPCDEIAGLKDAIQKDKEAGAEAMDGEVGNWFTRLLSKAGKGSVKIGVDVVASVVSKAVMAYLGAA